MSCRNAKLSLMTQVKTGIGILFLVLTFGCSIPIEDGLESLQGSWSVTEIVEIEEIILGGGTAEKSQLVIENPDGLFEFDGQEVDYHYTLSQSEVSGIASYSLTSFKENSGFTRVTRFELQIGERTYLTVFDDDTKKSYKDATVMTLTEKTQLEDIETTVILTLNKQE